MMDGVPTYVIILQTVVLPIVTAVIGWFTNAWRNKQKKENDILKNVTQILEMQRNYIAEQDEEKRSNANMIKRLEAKLDRKNKSIRQAFKCQHSADGDGCPVLNEDENSDPCQDKCETCTFNPQKDDKGKD